MKNIQKEVMESAQLTDAQQEVFNGVNFFASSTSSNAAA